MTQKKIFFCFLILLSFLFVSPTLAYKTISAAPDNLGSTVLPTGISKTELPTAAGNFIRVALTLVGTVFLALMIYGGFTWMTAQGAEDKITKAKETIIAASIGIAVILAAFAITTFITDRLVTQKPVTTTPGGPNIEPLPPTTPFCDLHPEQPVCQPIPVEPANPQCDLHPENPGC